MKTDPTIQVVDATPPTLPVTPLAHNLVDQVPVSPAIAAAVLGILFVVTRSGWLSLFMAATTVNQIEVLPVLCTALLPVWLLVTDRPELVITPPAVPNPGTPASSRS